MAKIKVIHDAVKPQPKEVLADAIVKIGEASATLHQSGLNEEAVIVLLAAKSGIGKGDVRVVLNGLRQLRAWYCR